MEIDYLKKLSKKELIELIQLSEDKHSSEMEELKTLCNSVEKKNAELREGRKKETPVSGGSLKLEALDLQMVSNLFDQCKFSSWGTQPSLRSKIESVLESIRGRRTPS